MLLVVGLISYGTRSDENKESKAGSSSNEELVLEIHSKTWTKYYWTTNLIINCDTDQRSSTGHIKFL